jgi:hypothetical protein
MMNWFRIYLMFVMIGVWLWFPAYCRAQETTVTPVDDTNVTVTTTVPSTYDQLQADYDAKQEAVDQLTQEQDGQYQAYQQRIDAAQEVADAAYNLLNSASTQMGKSTPVKQLGKTTTGT